VRTKEIRGKTQEIRPRDGVLNGRGGLVFEDSQTIIGLIT
jgi:hypothetical protein